jgi:hypothetical protein
MMIKVGLSRGDLASICAIFGKAFSDIAALLGTPPPNVTLDSFTRETFRGPHAENEKVPAAGRPPEVDYMTDGARARLLENMRKYGYGDAQDLSFHGVDGIAMDLRYLVCRWCQGCRRPVGKFPAVECAACGRFVLMTMVHR